MIKLKYISYFFLIVFFKLQPQLELQLSFLEKQDNTNLTIKYKEYISNIKAIISCIISKCYMPKKNKGKQLES